MVSGVSGRRGEGRGCMRKVKSELKGGLEEVWHDSLTSVSN